MTRKTVFTLDIGGYAPGVTALTLPYLRSYADKIGAHFHIITERRFPDWPVAVEKLQIYDLGRGNDWNIYFDADVLVHPDLFDITEHLDRGTVLHWGNDLLGNRFTYDHCFRRDGRHIGSGNWLAVASGWCLDLWHPPEQTLAEVTAAIHPTVRERNFGIKPAHLADDYLLSRNIARFGLKFKNFQTLQKEIGREGEVYFQHNYLLTESQKVAMIQDAIANWELIGPRPVTLSPAAQLTLAEMRNGKGLVV